MKLTMGDWITVLARKSATFPKLIYPARSGEVLQVFEEGDVVYAELMLDDGAHIIISAPVDELQKELS